MQGTQATPSQQQALGGYASLRCVLHEAEERSASGVRSRLWWCIADGQRTWRAQVCGPERPVQGVFDKPGGRGAPRAQRAGVCAQLRGHAARAL